MTRKKPFEFGIGNAEKGMRNVEGGSGNGEEGIRNAECGSGNGEGGKGNAEWGMRKLEVRMRKADRGAIWHRIYIQMKTRSFLYEQSGFFQPGTLNPEPLNLCSD